MDPPVNLGGIYLALGRYAEAREMLERSIALEPDYAAYSNLATLHFHEARYPDAARMFEKALELEDTDYRIWGNMAAAWYWSPDGRAKARDAYQRAITLVQAQLQVNPEDYSASSYLALFLAMVEDSEASRTVLHHLEQLVIEDIEVLFLIGYSNEVLGAREKALLWIGKAVTHGYARAMIAKLPGLRSLREDPQFDDLFHDVP